MADNNTEAGPIPKDTTRKEDAGATFVLESKGINNTNNQIILFVFYVVNI